MRNLVTVVVISAFLSALALLLFLLWTVSTSFEHNIRFRCGIAPAADRQLEDWLSAQNGVSNVLIYRVNGEMRVSYVIHQNLMQTKPSTPQVRSILEAMGYRDIRDYKEWTEKYMRD